MVNEQATPTSGGGVEFLKAARDKGCKIAKGGVLRSAPGKPTVLYKKADYDSDQGYFKIGDELYIKDNFIQYRKDDTINTFIVEHEFIKETDELNNLKLQLANRKYL